MADNPWIPDAFKTGLTARQAVFLADEGREVLYGGAGGGGKSAGLLMAAAQYATVPGYHALILRRTHKQLAKAESILSLSKEWWAGRVAWNGDTHTWTFPSGATVEFGHIEHADARYNYQGAAYQFVGYDELTQFLEPMYTYLFTRQRRRVGSPTPIRMRATSNPGGVGHEWVKRRFIDPRTRKPDARFIPAKLQDNPNIDRDQYAATLAELDPLTRAQILDGDWDAVSGGRFLPHWWRYYTRRGRFLLLGPSHAVHLDTCSVFLTVDPAASEKTTADYTVISAWAVTPCHNLVWLGCVRDRWEIPDIVPRVQAAYRRWGARWVGIEVVASNAGVYQLARRTEMVCRQLSPKGADKLVRATPAMILAQTGRVWLPAPEADPGFPLDDVVGELTRFTGTDEDAHDDICLAAGTPVETDHGPVPIQHVRPGDRVLTRSGYRRVLAAACTGRSAPVRRVVLTDGRTLIGTAAHRVYVAGVGFRRLDTLGYADMVVAWNPQSKPSSSTGELTGGTPSPSGGTCGCTSGLTPPTRSPLGPYTGTSGSSSTGRSHPGTTSITPTGTRSTTTPPTCCASPAPSTDGSTPSGGRTDPPPCSPTWTASDTWRPSGTGPTRGGPGTAATPSKPGPAASPSIASASAAGRLGSLSPAAVATSIVAGRVPPLPGGSPGSMTWSGLAATVAGPSASTDSSPPGFVPVRVLSVSAAGVADVFNLRVDGDAEYVAGGILTHNCDTLSYAAECLGTMPTADDRRQAPTVFGG